MIGSIKIPTERGCRSVVALVASGQAEIYPSPPAVILGPQQSSDETDDRPAYERVLSDDPDPARHESGDHEEEGHTAWTDPNTDGQKCDG